MFFYFLIQIIADTSPLPFTCSKTTDGCDYSTIDNQYLFENKCPIDRKSCSPCEVTLTEGKCF